MFELYHFVKELQEHIVCDNPLICKILNFLIPLEEILSDKKNVSQRLVIFSLNVVLKKRINKFFIPCINGLLMKMRHFRQFVI